ncbi:His Kinase A (phospho-acceptor) domain-containing protein [Anaerosporobacter mobilis DSM 15930]|uniref:histidine kinase n=1 Tax=Anaerosporobacter mobilis DSM 15930 TaxID=1120996 RepID=A0A1M7F546_9FIRM|nr:HAMP domain-containing sensor histidine kinase [Anaerosporobacter mobilis]SHL98878.1 His Kinase A (phospho-acceptor) domain-containing protein [Anaerosporobacter mobilis DSM 15930]
MKKRLIQIIVICIAIITCITGICLYKVLTIKEVSSQREWIVKLNEVEKLLEKSIMGENKEITETDYIIIQETIRDLQDSMRGQKSESGLEQHKKQLFYLGALIYIIFISNVLLLFGYIYHVVIKPFDRLTDFATSVSRGDFDTPVQYERKNLFGAFTWAFDSMRCEVKASRKAQELAIENNKTVIATISHDIKTPIASIRAYTEALQANMDTNQDRRERYYSTIMRKCDEVTKLTNDLFLHSISDLQRLEIQMNSCKIDEELPEMLTAIAGDNSRIRLCSKVPNVMIEVDRRRFEQILENLITNACKYAGDGTVEVLVSLEQNHSLQIYIQDQGPGIPDGDMPFIFEKFYRGQNAFDKQGAGLGLYIVKYLVEEMNGTIQLENKREGLGVKLTFPVQ